MNLHFIVTPRDIVGAFVGIVIFSIAAFDMYMRNKDVRL